MKPERRVGPRAVYQDKQGTNEKLTTWKEATAAASTGARIALLDTREEPFISSTLVGEDESR